MCKKLLSTKTISVDCWIMLNQIGLRLIHQPTWPNCFIIDDFPTKHSLNITVVHRTRDTQGLYQARHLIFSNISPFRFDLWNSLQPNTRFNRSERKCKKYDVIKVTMKRGYYRLVLNKRCIICVFITITCPGIYLFKKHAHVIVE